MSPVTWDVALPDTESAGAVVRKSPASRAVRNKLRLLVPHPVSGIVTDAEASSASRADT